MTEENRNKINAMRCRASDGTKTLIASRSLACAEHNERIRKLRDLDLILSIRSESRTGEMFELESIINPELQRLLNDPTHSL